MEDEILFSRVNRVGEPVAELRANIARFKLAVLDSVAISESRASGKLVSRTDLVDRIITEWVSQKVDEASLIKNALSEYPTVMESGGKND
jgi:hypothetical protein